MSPLYVDVSLSSVCDNCTGIFQSIVRLSGAVWDHVTQQVFLPPKVRTHIPGSAQADGMHASDVMYMLISHRWTYRTASKSRRPVCCSAPTPRYVSGIHSHFKCLNMRIPEIATLQQGVVYSCRQLCFALNVRTVPKMQQEWRHGKYLQVSLATTNTINTRSHVTHNMYLTHQQPTHRPL